MPGKGRHGKKEPLRDAVLGWDGEGCALAVRGIIQSQGWLFSTDTPFFKSDPSPTWTQWWAETGPSSQGPQARVTWTGTTNSINRDRVTTVIVLHTRPWLWQLLTADLTQSWESETRTDTLLLSKGFPIYFYICMHHICTYINMYYAKLLD